MPEDVTLTGVLKMLQQLNQRVEVLEKKESRPSQSGGFTTQSNSIPVTVKREGDSLWYIPDKDNNDIHHPIASTRLEGRFAKLEVIEGEYKGSPTKTAVLHVEVPGENTTYRLRMTGADFSLGKAMVLRSFLSSFDRVPVEALEKDLIFSVYPGKEVQVVMCCVLDPETGKTFPPKSELTREESLRLWQDGDHFKRLLTEAIAKINGDQPEQPSESAPTLDLEGVCIVGVLRGVGELTPSSSGSGRVYVRFTITSDDRCDYECFAWDAIASALSQRTDGERVRATGGFIEKNGQVFFRVDDVRAIASPKRLVTADQEGW
jgi:hypothetical protein